MSATENSITHKEGTLTIYCQDVNYVLETYAIDDIFTEAAVDIKNYKEPEVMSQSLLRDILGESLSIRTILRGVITQECLHGGITPLDSILYEDVLGRRQRRDLKRLGTLDYLLFPIETRR